MEDVCFMPRWCIDAVAYNKHTVTGMGPTSIALLESFSHSDQVQASMLKM